ncbi:MAG: DNA translocase FtsK [Chloroflexota bacterium]
MAEQNTRRISVPDDPEAEHEEEDYPVDPEVWDALLDAIPPWGDEIVALLLIIFGILSFLSILDVLGTAPIAAAWATSLMTLFGHGSFIVSGGILLLGVVIVLSNVGVVIRFPARRIIALEIAFIASLALLHLFVSRGVETEMRPIARAGEGGGLVGWALSYPFSMLVGYTTVSAFYGFMLAFALGVAAGVNRNQIKKVVAATQSRFEKWAAYLAESPTERRKRRRVEGERRNAAARRRALALESPELMLRTPVLRIRPNMDNIPPSMRYGAKTAEEEEIEDDLAEHPLFTGEAREDLANIVGELIEEKGRKKSDKKDKQVKRPDGRVKKYFSVNEMDESRKTGRRKKDWPDLNLMEDVPLNRPDEAEINTNVVLIENTLLEFDVDIDVVDVKVGPTVTQYLVKPFRDDDSERKQRTRISKIASYQNDLALALSAKRLRIEAPVPGTTYVGIEVPNKNPSIVALRSVYESKTYYEALQKAKTPLFIPLGRDVSGEPFMIDLAAMPHTLVAGTTGSGKSVSLAAITIALILHNTPAEVRLIMLDPKMVELSRFNGLPHLMGPVETDTERIIGVLRWCTREMDDRYQKLADTGERNIANYNKKMEKERGEKLPYIAPRTGNCRGRLPLC